MRKQKERKDKLIRVRVSESELEAAKNLQRSSRPQVTFSAWCRDRIIKRVQPRPLFRDVGVERQFLADFARVGSNLNQLARAANVSGTADAAAMKKEAQELWRLVLRAMRGQ